MRALEPPRADEMKELAEPTPRKRKLVLRCEGIQHEGDALPPAVVTAYVQLHGTAMPHVSVLLCAECLELAKQESKADGTTLSFTRLIGLQQ